MTENEYTQVKALQALQTISDQLQIVALHDEFCGEAIDLIKKVEAMKNKLWNEIELEESE